MVGEMQQDMNVQVMWALANEYIENGNIKQAIVCLEALIQNGMMLTLRWEGSMLE